jgi:hypothetical protein
MSVAVVQSVLTPSDALSLFTPAQLEVFRKNPLLNGNGVTNDSIQAYKAANPFPLVHDGGVEWKFYKQYDYDIGDLADSRTTAQMEAAISASGIPQTRYKLLSHPTEGMDSVTAGYYSLLVAASNSGGFGAIIPANAAGRAGLTIFPPPKPEDITVPDEAAAKQITNGVIHSNEAYGPGAIFPGARYPQTTQVLAKNGSVTDNVGQDYVLLLLPNGAIIHGYLDENALAFYKKGIKEGTVKAWHAAAPNNGSKFRSLDYETYFQAALFSFLEESTKGRSKEELVQLLKNGYAEKLMEALASKEVGVNLLTNKLDANKLPDLPGRFVVEVDNFGNGTLSVTYNEVLSYGIDPATTPLVFAAQGKDGKWRSKVSATTPNRKSFETPFGSLGLTESSKPDDITAKTWGETNSKNRYVAGFIRKKTIESESFASHFNLKPGAEFAACPQETLEALKALGRRNGRAAYIDDAALLNRLTRAGLVNGFDSRALTTKLELTQKNEKGGFTAKELNEIFPSEKISVTNARAQTSYYAGRASENLTSLAISARTRLTGRRAASGQDATLNGGPH